MLLTETKSILNSLDVHTDKPSRVLMVYRIQEQDYPMLFDLLSQSHISDYISTPLPSMSQLQLLFTTIQQATLAYSLLSLDFKISFLDLPERLLTPSFLTIDRSITTSDVQSHNVHRNFLLSPPGSPPVGWVQTKEDISPGGLLLFTLDGGRVVEDDVCVEPDTPVTIKFGNGIPDIVIHEL